jgi:sulfite reductase (NADPH) hemoprotein beta-component
MYIYSDIDQKIIDERAAQFRGQTRRYLAQELKADEYRPLRLQNGLYVQRHAPMLRVAVPYGLLNARQLRMLAQIADHYDKGYCHVTTRQNVQFHWPELSVVPDILADLASVQMHAVQTSGNCIRNITTDQYAGVIASELEDPRPYCELMRQWSTFHPEFAYLPRKFKIALTAGTDEDRAAIRFHDIGIELYQNEAGENGFKVFVGGGLGRTPIIAEEIGGFVAKQDILSYLEAILRVYNRYGRRDNKFKARIKILVKALGADAFRAKVEAEWNCIKDSPLRVPAAEFERLRGFFQPPAYQTLTDQPDVLADMIANSPGFKHWYQHNTVAHKIPGYRIVNLSLKPTGVAPGDITSEQLRALADLADQHSFGEVRTTHNQNIVLADVRQDVLPELWQTLKSLGFATANIGKLTDLICCPGGDFCSLANAKSIPIAEQIQRRFDDLDYLYDLGNIELNISGCMNACGHHHVGSIGILGVDKKGQEFYQISLGGCSGRDAAIGQIIGPSFSEHEIADVIEKIINTFVAHRHGEESFLQVVRRIGIDPFKERVYATDHS